MICNDRRQSPTACRRQSSIVTDHMTENQAKHALLRPVHTRDIYGDFKCYFFDDLDGEKNSHVSTASDFTVILQIQVTAISQMF